jgi:hypothetical protein
MNLRHMRLQLIQKRSLLLSLITIENIHTLPCYLRRHAYSPITSTQQICEVVEKYRSLETH